MTMYHEIIQRIRITFAVSEPLTYVSVLDLGRTWERLLVRADIPVAYSQGFNPHMRMAFAAALPVGYASECEAVDVFLGREMAPEAVLTALNERLPMGLRLIAAENVDIKGRSLQALMREARYHLSLYSDASADVIDKAVAAFLAREEIPRQRRKKKGRMSTYNMRPLVLDLARVDTCDAWHRLELHVLCGNQGSGRPEEVIQELGLPVSQYTITRTTLIWDEPAAPIDKEAAS